MRMRPMAAAAVVALACAAALPAAGQGTPEEVVEQYYSSFRSGDFTASAALMDPAALEELRSAVARMAALTGGSAEQLQESFGVSSAAELEAVPPRVLYERVLRATLGSDEARQLLSTAEVHVLGHVPEGPEHAHVVYRMRMGMGEMQLDQVQVAPVRRTAEGWRVMLTGSLAGMLQGLQAAPAP